MTSPTPRPPEGRNVAEQNAAYRRGVVLGLTMAEAGILIIFVLLLLIGFDEWTRVSEQDRMKGMARISQTELTRLQKAESQLLEITQSVGMTLPADSHEIAVLVRTVRQASDDPHNRSALKETREVLREMQRVRDEIRAKGSAILTRMVEEQGFRVANQEGQLKHLQTQLESAGLGKGERPCWVRRDGTIEYLFDVVLASDGIRMRENVFPTRRRERETLPIPPTDPTKTLSQAEFVRRTQPLYESSLAANCRFFVVVYDATGPTEKERYKDLLRTVEGHFYKRLSTNAAPF